MKYNNIGLGIVKREPFTTKKSKLQIAFKNIMCAIGCTAIIFCFSIAFYINVLKYGFTLNF